MRRYFFNYAILLTAFSFVLFSCKKDDEKENEMINQVVEENVGIEVGLTAPDFTLKNTDDQDVSLSDFRGQVVLVEFWASWCSKCRNKSDEILEIYDTYKDSGFEILGLSIDENKQSWLKAIEDDGLIFPNVIDTDGFKSMIVETYKVQGIPTMFLLDKDGRILLITHSDEELKEMLEKIF